MHGFTDSVQQLRSFAESLQNKFSENGVGPGEPGARELLRVVLVKRLVNETRTGVSFLKSRQTLLDLAVLGGSQSFDNHPQRPDHIHPHVRPTQPTRRL